MQKRHTIQSIPDSEDVNCAVCIDAFVDQRKGKQTIALHNAASVQRREVFSED